MNRIEQILKEILQRIILLEKDSHPCKELHEFEAYPPLMSRIEALNQRIKALEEQH